MRFLRPFSLLFAALLAGGCQRPQTTDPRLQAPAALEREAVSRRLKKIFVNPEARPLLASLPLAAASPQDAAAAQSPPLWRKLDRSARFDAVVLAGQAGAFLPLAAHLAASPDFRLAYVDNWGALFVRGVPSPYEPPAVDAEKFSQTAERGFYLSQMALQLDAVGQAADALDYMTAALDCAPEEPSVHTRAAALSLSRKRYAEALREAAHALALAPHDLAALEVKARAFSAAGDVDQAWEVATELKSRAGDRDMNVLFLHARLANAAHAYSAEQASLERLIQLAEQQRLPATDYRVYLGQCYAKQGLARPALAQLEAALSDPDLTSSQRADIATAVESIRSRSRE